MCAQRLDKGSGAACKHLLHVIILLHIIYTSVKIQTEQVYAYTYLYIHILVPFDDRNSVQRKSTSAVDFSTAQKRREATGAPLCTTLRLCLTDAQLKHLRRLSFSQEWKPQNFNACSAPRIRVRRSYIHSAPAPACLSMSPGGGCLPPREDVGSGRP